MGSPQRQRLAHLSPVIVSIVGAGDASTEAGRVTKHTFDDMRGRAELGHATCGSSAQVMQRPPRQHLPATPLSYAGVGLILALGPILITAAPTAEHHGTIARPRARLQDLDSY